MLFNPFKYQYETIYLRDEGENAVLKIRQGTEEAEIFFPKMLLPPELHLNETTMLVIEPQEAFKETESAVLKKLLEELVR